MNQREKAELLRRLHASPEVLVLPNAWDAISARVAEAEGCAAVATTSAGLAAVFGYPDGQKIPRSEMLFLIGKIAGAVQVPVTADIEAGYDDPTQTARDVIASGAVGMNLEDMVDDVLTPLDRQIELLRAVRAASTAAGVPLVINARTDIFLARHGDEGTRFDRAVERLNAFHEAGADCLFAPGVADAETIGRLAQALKGPLNVLTSAGTPSVAELKSLGVRRLSLGSGPSRVALGAYQRLVRTLRDSGTFAALATEAVPFPEVQKLLSRN
ncbi:MAG TPA: isocitrate lyase/phosphoenolpyruvate mutase family protein [Bryobacteraceae bacterium]|jgi:2-methylisocitrate lyase-like PEP mutase family enzyme|nr:isocitrate lyase/phosphoenolpyruvate mutase family protein [Bryobacteraceae bacterium]